MTASTPGLEYTGELRALGELLIAAAKNAPGTWIRRRIARGSVLVALRLRPKRNRWELCISRDVAPAGLAEKSRWEGEVRSIQRELGVLTWDRGEDAFSGDAVAATFSTPIGSGDLQHDLGLTSDGGTA